MPHDLCDALLAKIGEQAERTLHLIELIPDDRLDTSPVPGQAPLAGLLGHLLESMAGFCAVLAAVRPELAAEFLELRSLQVNHACGKAEASRRIAQYRTAIAAGFDSLSDADLASLIPTIFVPAGEPLLTLLLGNLEHLINHKHQLFTYLKLLDIPVASRDLYRFRGIEPDSRNV